MVLVFNVLGRQAALARLSRREEALGAGAGVITDVRYRNKPRATIHLLSEDSRKAGYPVVFSSYPRWQLRGLLPL